MRSDTGGYEIEDIYSLTPLQQGMLFHTLYEKESGTYIEQFTCSFRGPLQTSAFEHAWHQVLGRHAVLRTAFLWEDEELEEPLQVVYREPEIRVQIIDIRHFSTEKQEQHLAEHVQAERSHGFDVSSPPLMRLSLLRKGEDEWLFLWSYHHALLDGWSVPLVLQEVIVCYNAAITASIPSLPRVRPFRDYIAWLRRQSLPEAEAFWRKTLDGLPREAGRLWWTNAHGMGMGRQTRDLGHERAQGLRTLSRRYHLTLNTICQGTWALLLSRYSGRTEVVFGTTVAGRSAELDGIEEIVGPCINTLPVRVRIIQEQPLADWMGELQQKQVQARQYEYAHLGQVQQWSGLPGGTPLFESLLLFENYPVTASFLQLAGGIKIHSLRSFEQTSYPLTLAFALRQERIEMHILYDQSRLSNHMVTSLIEHFLELLSSIIKRQEGQVRHLNFLTEQERYHLLVAWNPELQPEQPEICLHTSIEAQVSRTPEAIALVYENEHITYAELDRRAGALAAHLQTLGVRPEMCVGVCLKRTPLLVISLLAVLKAGGAYVPLDPEYPHERLLFILKDAKVALLLTDQDLASRFALSDVTTFVLDEGLSIFDSESLALSSPEMSATHLAYLIYTSGSTGYPKGVAITHANAVAFLHWVGATFSTEDLAGVLASTSVCFDLSIFELFAPLMVGGSLLLIEQVTLLATLPARERVTLVNTVPSAVTHLLETKALSVGVQCVNLAGEPLRGALVERIYRQTHVRRVYNLYGPTESTTYATYTLLPPGNPGNPSIGRPITNTQAYVLDERMRLLPMGVVGELYLGGSGVARGYLDLPELTAQCFVPHPFSSQPGARLYRTGDLVCWQDKGCLAFVGRRDQQVKVRGFRMELGEIEAVLEELLPIRAAIVLVQQEEEQERTQLVACVVSLPGTRLSLGQVRAALGKRLPGHMLPNRLATLEQMPTLPNGKTDRQRVAELVRETSEEEEEGKEEPEPASEVERVLLTIWKQVLRRERVGLHTNFFDLSGDSILSLQVVAQARQKGIYLQPRDIFQYQTVEMLARHAQISMSQQEPASLPHGPIPLTPIQRWFFSLEQPEPHHWNQSMVLEISGPFSFSSLETTWSLLQKQHGAFALRFTQHEEEWEQWSMPDEAQDSFRSIDLGELSEQESRHAFATIAATVQMSLDLGHGPLARAVLFTFNQPQVARLLLVIHHLIVDSVSWSILLDDFQALHQQLLLGSVPLLPVRTASFQEWAVGLAQYTQALSLKEEQHYWLNELQALEQLMAFPEDFPGKNSTLATVKIATLELGEKETAQLQRDLPAQVRVQPEQVILAALQRAYARWTNSSTFWVDIEGHGREQIVDEIDLSHSTGWFTALFPLILNIEQRVRPLPLVRAVKEKLLRARQHSLSYGVLCYLAPETSDARLLRAFPRAPVCFTYLGSLDQARSGGSMLKPVSPATGPHRSPAGTFHYRHEISASISNQRLSISWLYSEEKYRATTIEQLIRQTNECLQELIAACLSSLSLEGLTPTDFPEADLSQEELGHILAILNQTGETPHGGS